MAGWGLRAAGKRQVRRSLYLSEIKQFLSIFLKLNTLGYRPDCGIFALNPAFHA
jgi:hypothetical protein